MFECLSGTMPYPGNYAQVLLRVAGEESIPSVRTAAEGVEISAALGHVVDRAIAKSRDARFQHVDELRSAIETAVPGATTATNLLGPPPAPKKGTAETGPQRRRTPRAPYNTPVRLVLGGGVLDGRTEDISESGILVLTQAACAPSQRVGVRFALPMEGRVVSVEADVRWVRLAERAGAEGLRAIGLEFVALPEPVRASIARYVELMTSKRQT
jgi:hypothetical protein